MKTATQTIVENSVGSIFTKTDVITLMQEQVNELNKHYESELETLRLHYETQIKGMQQPVSSGLTVTSRIAESTDKK